MTIYNCCGIGISYTLKGNNEKVLKHFVQTTSFILKGRTQRSENLLISCHGGVDVKKQVLRVLTFFLCTRSVLL